MDDYAQFSSDVLDESTLPVYREIGGNVEIGEEVDDSGVSVGGNVEIGEAFEFPDDSFLGLPRYEGRFEIGNGVDVGLVEIGNGVDVGNMEINGDMRGNVDLGAALAIRKVLTVARDNRQPAPPMKAVDVDAPERDPITEWALTDTFIGAAEATGNPDPYPLLASLMQRCGAMTAPRFVRVDTPESYEAFRAAGSPEMTEFREKLEALERKLDDHLGDPHAHEQLANEWDRLSFLGAEAEQAIAEKRIEFDLPPGFEGKHDEWLEGNEILASIKIPHRSGSFWWLTSGEPLGKSVNEASRHAAEANVPASLVGADIQSIGERLGAATAIKEMVAAVPAILQRPEAQGGRPFMVRVEPKGNPALCGLAMLALACRGGNAQACDEWQRLSASAPAQVRQAMLEALELAKKAK